MPEISVVIPTYRRPGLLMICLQHLEFQALEKSRFDVLVVTDGLDEKTKQAIEDFKKSSSLEITCLSTPEKKGPAAARNLGWRSSKSPIIAFTDDDCRPESGWLLSFLSRYGEIAETAVFSGYTLVPIGNNPTDHALNTHGLQHADFITANCACSREALEITGGFDERYGSAWREDSDLEFNFIKHRIPIYKAMEAVVVHPVREAPWGFSIKEQKKGQYDALLYKKYPELYRSRCAPKIIYDFYFIMLCDLVCLFAILSGEWYVAAVTFIAVFVMIAAFFALRIKRTKKTLDHIWEMWVTSMVIPFLSVYWRLYGSVKYRVLFI